MSQKSKAMIPMDKIMDFLEGHLGVTSEIVYHDLTLPYDQTIVDIRNGKITGRTLGGCGSNLGLEVIRGTQRNWDRFYTFRRTAEGFTYF